MSQACSHDLVFITKRRFHVAEYYVRLGKVEPWLEHTHPFHEVHVRCQHCMFDETYDIHQVPAWVLPHLEKIAELERQAKLRDLLAELTEPIDLNLLDELLDAGVDPDAVVGKLADWHGEEFPIVQLADKRIAIQIALTCSECHANPITAYVCSGLHSGAFCYAYSFEGDYEANLRDQVYICEACGQKRETR